MILGKLTAAEADLICDCGDQGVLDGTVSSGVLCVLGHLTAGLLKRVLEFERCAVSAEI